MKLPETRPGSEQPLDQEASVLDLLCISWMLWTSLDWGINQLTLKFLASIIMSPGFKTTFVVDCFKMLTSSVSITDNNQAEMLQGSEQLAGTAAACLLGAVSYSLIVNPKSNILKDTRSSTEFFYPQSTSKASLSTPQSVQYKTCSMGMIIPRASVGRVLILPLQEISCLCISWLRLLGCITRGWDWRGRMRCPAGCSDSHSTVAMGS